MFRVHETSIPHSVVISLCPHLAPTNATVPVSVVVVTELKFEDFEDSTKAKSNTTMQNEIQFEYLSMISCVAYNLLAVNWEEVG